MYQAPKSFNIRETVACNLKYRCILVFLKIGAQFSWSALDSRVHSQTDMTHISQSQSVFALY